jgi:hypothetical protein
MHSTCPVIGMENSPIFLTSNVEIIVYYCQSNSMGNIIMCLGCIVRAVLLVFLALVQGRWLVQKRKQISHRVSQLYAIYLYVYICFGAVCGSNKFILGGKTCTRDYY